MKQELLTQKQVETAAEIIAEYNLNPVEELARLTNEAKQRGDDLTVESICKFLMPYIHPKQKYVSMDIGMSVSDEELVARLKRGRSRLAETEQVVNRYGLKRI